MSRVAIQGLSIQSNRMSVRGAGMPVGRAIELQDEHRRNIRQAIFRFKAGKMPAVAHEFAGHLVGNERGAAARGQRMVGPLQQIALFPDTQKTERNS